MRRFQLASALGATALSTLLLAATAAHATLANIALPPAPVAVTGPIGSPPAGITDLKFKEMFKTPVGPKGLEPSERLLALHGRKVRLVGYMATQEESRPGGLILTPMPVNLGDEDESLSDDLPGNAVFIHLNSKYAAKAVPNLQGLLRMTGTLSVGAFEEADGHVSSIRLELDEPTSRLLTTRADANPHASRKPVGRRHQRMTQASAH
jgi:hypothetical protein